MPWSEVKDTVNPLWAQGFRHFCTTPKSRHSTHSSWSTVDWHWIWSDSFGDTPQNQTYLVGGYVKVKGKA
jgi:hypothetical protein